MQASRRERFDLAVIDINLNGDRVYPLADELSAREVPFIFLSGYLPANLPQRYRGRPHVTKPHDPVALIKEIRAAVHRCDPGGPRGP
jgi:hypothetical protein